MRHTGKTPIRILLLSSFLLCLIFNTAGIKAQQTVCKNTTGQEYLLYFPQTYGQSNGDSYPLLIFLHGVGERGTDIEKVKTHGPPKLIEQGADFPFLVVSPQARGEWIHYDIYQLVEHLKKEYAVDPDRIYLTGIGYGVWDLAMQYPRLFAAIAPVCGGGESARAWRLRHTAVWCFHGALDDVVPVEASSVLVNATRKLNPDVKFNLLPGVMHDSWIQAYDESNDLYDWLLQQKRFDYQEKQVTAGALEMYSGAYISADSTVLSFFVEGGALMMQQGCLPKVRLKAFAADSFFDESSTPTEFIFGRNKDTGIPEVLVMGRDYMRYERLVPGGCNKDL